MSALDIINITSLIFLTLFYLVFDRSDNFIDTSPLVFILSAALYYAEALKDVDDVVDSSAFDTELLCALVEVEEASLRRSVQK